jgi:hypothetical protein
MSLGAFEGPCLLMHISGNIINMHIFPSITTKLLGIKKLKIKD